MSGQRYLVTARKYRPQIFGELVAQEHVSETLKNAIRLDRLAHAYLFSGPRGVGKTTAARILAKAINCTMPLDQRESGAEPCRQCESCRTFEEGRSMNIIEIDAASNNRVDDVREIRETVRIPPQGGRKKVYIVDEVHMLSTAAFNALLKTLEEPPPHVLFIFATTEPHKVLPTILSRCQRFDFRRIAVPEIVARLSLICGEESIVADEASLMLIARKGDGALRDALSVFDQAVSLCGAELTYADLAHALGVVDVDLYFEVTENVAAQNSAGMLRLIDRIVRSGYDLQEFLAGLAEHLRNLFVARTMEDTSLIEAAESTQQRYLGAVEAFTEPDLLRLLTLVSDAENSIKSSTHPRLRLETAMLKMATLALGADLRRAIQKIDRLEELIREGKFPPGGNGGTPAPAGPGEGAPRAPRKREPGERAESVSAGVTETAVQKVAEEDSGYVAASAPPPQAGLSSTPAPASTSGDSGSAAHILGKPALKRRNEESKAEASVPPEAATPQESDAGAVGEIWDDLLDRIKHDKIQVWSLLHHTRPAGFRDGTALIAVPNEFHHRMLTSLQDYILEQFRGLAPVRGLTFIVREEMEVPDAEETASDFDPYEYMQRKRQENPVIRAIFDQFGGELVW